MICVKLVLLASSLILSHAVGAQTITTVNENLATSSSTFLVDTNSPRIYIGTTSYTGSVPGAVLFVGSNVVIGTNTGALNENVFYSSGSIVTKNVKTTTVTWADGSTSTTAAASLAGSNNTFTASNTFTGLTKITAGATIMFASSLSFTSAQATFTPTASVTGSTISFTVVGSTVSCWLIGTVDTNAACRAQMGIGVDGKVSAVPGTSASIGLVASDPSAAGFSNLSFGPLEFQVVPGAHSFWVGLWTGAACTATFPDAASIAQFGCREVPSR